MSTIGFLDSSKQNKVSVIATGTFTNSICYGATGTGKSTGFILPNVEKAIQKGHGALIYDYKGNLHMHVKALANQNSRLSDVYEVGKPWGIKTNLLENFNHRELSKIYSQIHGQSKDDYWQNASRNLFLSIYNLMHCDYQSKNLIKNDFAEFINLPMKRLTKMNKEVTFEKLMQNLSSLKNLKIFIRLIKNSTHRYRIFINSIISNDELHKKLSVLIREVDKMEKTLKNLSAYAELDDKGNEGGKHGVLSSLNTVLAEISENEYINSPNSSNITELLRNGKIVIINVESFSENILNMLNSSIYNRLQFLRIQDRKPVSIFIDEAQKVLHKDSLPDVDVCRENKFEYILATQDKILLSMKLEQSNTESLLRNIVNQYSFATTNNAEDTFMLDKFEYRNLMTNKNNIADPIFIDNEKLYKTELQYQKKMNILDYIDTEYSKQYIIKYDALLYSYNKIEAHHSDGYIETCEYYENFKDIVNSYKCTNPNIDISENRDSLA